MRRRRNEYLPHHVISPLESLGLTTNDSPCITNSRILYMSIKALNTSLDTIAQLDDCSKVTRVRRSSHTPFHSLGCSGGDSELSTKPRNGNNVVYLYLVGTKRLLHDNFPIAAETPFCIRYLVQCYPLIQSTTSSES